MMLGSNCSPCCVDVGQCQDFQAIASQWGPGSNVVLWSLVSQGLGQLPEFAAANQTAFYSDQYFSRIIDQGNARATFAFAVFGRNVWQASFTILNLTNQATQTASILLQCVDGTTVVTGATVSSPLTVDSQTFSCCCVQHGSTIIFPPANLNACDATGFGNPNCDFAINSSGQVKGICTRTENAFNGFFEAYAPDGMTLSVQLFDWRLFRTNPLP